MELHRQYWLGRIHGMREAVAIIRSALDGLPLASALECPNDIIWQIEMTLDDQDSRSLLMFLSEEDRQELRSDIGAQRSSPRRVRTRSIRRRSAT